MTDIYELWDHRCPELEKLLEEKKVRFQGWACWCSPIERHYQILENDEWKNIDKCPFCGEFVTAGLASSLVPTDITFSAIIGGNRTGMTAAGTYETLEFLALSTRGRTEVE